MPHGNRLRVQVTVSYPMRVALDVLAARNGLSASAQAAMTLRQGLERTMGTAAVQQIVANHAAQRNHAQWEQEVTAEHAIEKEYARYAGGLQADEVAGDRKRAAGEEDAMALASASRPEGGAF